MLFKAFVPIAIHLLRVAVEVAKSPPVRASTPIAILSSIVPLVPSSHKLAAFAPIIILLVFMPLLFLFVLFQRVLHVLALFFIFTIQYNLLN